METIVLRRTVRTPERRRRSLEAAGWRTWLSYQENHVRDAAGRMVGVQPQWLAEVEHPDGTAFAVAASSPAAAWLAVEQRIRSASAGGVFGYDRPGYGRRHD